METVAQLAVSSGILIGITSVGIVGILGVLVVLLRIVDHLEGMDGAGDQEGPEQAPKGEE